MKKKSIQLLLFFVISISLSGCGIFKKKCDCPGFGKKSSVSNFYENMTEIIAGI